MGASTESGSAKGQPRLTINGHEIDVRRLRIPRSVLAIAAVVILFTLLGRAVQLAFGAASAFGIGYYAESDYAYVNNAGVVYGYGATYGWKLSKEPAPTPGAGAPASSSSATATATAVPTATPVPEAVVLIADVPISVATGGVTNLTTASGVVTVDIPAAAIAIEGATLSVTDFSTAVSSILSGQSGSVTTPSGLVVAVGRTSSGTSADPGTRQITETVGVVAEITVTNPVTGLAITTLSAPIQLTLGFDVSAIPAALTVADVAVFAYDPVLGSWEEFPSVVDSVAGTVTGTIDHLSVFAVMVKIPVQRDLSTDLRYYGITDNYLAYAFKDRFDSTGGLDRYGYPRTSESIESGVTAQWFQRARFEWHPLNPEPYRVLLGLIGSELLETRGISFPVATAPTNGAAAGFRYHPETGHYVAFAFLKYFDENGGLDAFGYPVSEEFVENGLVVQYFQRGRFEYHPENSGTAYEVQLGLVGDELLRLKGRLSD